MAPVTRILSALRAKALLAIDSPATNHNNLHSRAPIPAPPTPCTGCIDPSKVNNKAYFALFALIFAAIVIVSIWFFFHAKNGGFHWHPQDWDDYKSTVLRRKDANGNTIYSGRSTVSKPSQGDRIAAKSVVGYDEKGRKGIMAVRGLGGSHSVYYSDGFSQYTGDRGSDTMTSVSRNEKPRSKPSKDTRIRGGHASDTEAPTNHSRRYRDRDLAEYKHEKPATVGGMNRSADGVTHDFGSDNRSDLTSSTTPILSASDKKRQKQEKKAAEDAARMERKWRKEAERAAAALAKESSSSAPYTAVAASPSKAKDAVATPPRASRPDRSTIRNQKTRGGNHNSSRSRSQSPQKKKQRDYSFSGGPDEASTAFTSTSYTATSTNRTASSYYDAYRPLVQSSPTAQQERAESRSRHSSASPSKAYRSERNAPAAAGNSGRYERVRSSPKKSSGAGRDVMAGYRRGGRDDLDSDSE